VLKQLEELGRMMVGVLYAVLNSEDRIKYWMEHQDEFRQKFSELLLGNASSAPAGTHLLNLDANPFVPEGWRGVAKDGHKKMGKDVPLERRGDDLYLNGKKIVFRLSEQQKGGYIKGEELRKELQDKVVLNANVLDYLLAHPDLIPESWKKDERGNTRFIYFWGTIYRDSSGSLYVRYLCWDGDCWDWDCHWLGLGWLSNEPAAVLAS
jgi:hypothetical protein